PQPKPHSPHPHTRNSNTVAPSQQVRTFQPRNAVTTATALLHRRHTHRFLDVTPIPTPNRLPTNPHRARRSRPRLTHSDAESVLIPTRQPGSQLPPRRPIRTAAPHHPQPPHKNVLRALLHTPGAPAPATPHRQSNPRRSLRLGGRSRRLRAGTEQIPVRRPRS